MSISVGAVGTASTVVTPENTAAAVGSGALPVFATPYMIALMENAACNAIADGLEEGQSSVGTKLDVSHDAATPVGMHVTAKAELVEVDRRRLVFRVTAEDDAGPIGQGTHERFLIMADKFLAKVDELQRRKSNVIIAASEGVKTADGTYLCDLVSTAGQLDAFGHKAVLSGTSRYLSELIHDKLNCKSRAIEFSTLQRCASHLASRTDVNEAYAVGGAAAAAAFAGETGKMISLKRISNYPYQCITEAVDVQQVANLEKKVPLDWITPDGMQVTAAFEEYARPLILDEVTPVYVNGTPRHIRL